MLHPANVRRYNNNHINRLRTATRAAPCNCDVISNYDLFTPKNVSACFQGFPCITASVLLVFVKGSCSWALYIKHRVGPVCQSVPQEKSIGPFFFFLLPSFLFFSSFSYLITPFSFPFFLSYFLLLTSSSFFLFFFLLHSSSFLLSLLNLCALSVFVSETSPLAVITPPLSPWRGAGGEA